MLMSDFFDSFNNALPEFGNNFGEQWILVTGVNAGEYSALCIEPLNLSSKNMLGGLYADASTTIDISTSVYMKSGVKKGSIVSCRGQQLAVMELQFDAIDDVTLICGPSQLDVWGR